MNIHELKASVITNNVANKSIDKKTTNPINTIAEQKEVVNDKGAQALKNYFLGTQNIPSFKGFDCATSEFNHNMMLVPCACCGKKMINGGENVEKLATELTKLKGEDRTKFIDETLEIYRPVQKAIIRGMREVGEKYPKKTTTELLPIMANDVQGIMKRGQLAVLDDVDKEAKEHYGEENKVSDYIKSQRKYVNGLEKNSKFNREKFVKDMDRITSELGDEHAKGHVLNIAIDMPFEDDYYNKMTKKIREPRKFINGLFSNAVKTAEHIHPKSLGGPNSTENYMSECNECNEKRQNYDLNTYWQTRYPSMPYNVQQFCDAVTENVINDKIGPHFVDYPKDLKVAVESETKGSITLKVLNPEEINKKREEKGLKPLPQPTKENVDRARAIANRRKPEPQGPVIKPQAPIKPQPVKTETEKAA